MVVGNEESVFHLSSQCTEMENAPNNLISCLHEYDSGLKVVYKNEFGRNKSQFIVLVQQTLAGGLLETVVTRSCTSNHATNIIAVSSRADACPVSCRFCGLSVDPNIDFYAGQNLAPLEVLSQVENAIGIMSEDGRFDLNIPMKIVFTKGSELLLNPDLDEIIETLIASFGSVVKVSTSFPNFNGYEQNFACLLDAIRKYPSMIRLQVSLISTDAEQRQSMVGDNVKLFDFYQVSEMCRKIVDAGARRPTISFTIGPETIIDVDSFAHYFSPDSAAVRLRPIIPNGTNSEYCFSSAAQYRARTELLTSAFLGRGYMIVPHSIEEQTEHHITAGYFIKLHKQASCP